MKRRLIFRITLCAISAALFVVLDTLSIKVGNDYKITMSGLPIIIVAIMFGPIDGMLVGFIGAFLGQLLSYGFTPTTLLWIIPAVVRGALVGLAAKKFQLIDKKILMVIVIVISSLVVTVLNTGVIVIDSLIYEYFSYTILTVKFIERIISSILTANLTGIDENSKHLR